MTYFDQSRPNLSKSMRQKNAKNPKNLVVVIKQHQKMSLVCKPCSDLQVAGNSSGSWGKRGSFQYLLTYVDTPPFL